MPGGAAPAASPGLPPATPGFPPAFGGRPAPTPVIEDHDSGDDDIRTMMRTPEQMIQEEESHDAPRTMLLRDDDPWPGAAPAPAAGGAWPGGMGGPMPAPTMALPAHYEPSSPGYGGSGPRELAPLPSPGPPEPFLGGLGTQKIPPGMVPAPPPNQGMGVAPPAPPAPPASPTSSAEPGFQPQMPYGPGTPDGLVPPPGMGMPNPHQQITYPDQGQSSKKGLVAAALIALLIAAAATFAFLKLKGL